VRLKFKWDIAKAKSNLKKHGVSFEEARTVFGDALSIVIVDSGHSFFEDRLILIGRSHASRLLVVVHVDHEEWVRIISAREATRKERRQYEEGIH